MRDQRKGLANAVLARRRQRTVRVESSAHVPFTDDMITRLVGQSDYQVEKSRTAPGFVHVSSLLDFCPRRLALVDKFKIDLVNRPKSGDRLIWAIGRAVEHHIRQSFFDIVSRKGVYGVWKCMCGKTSNEGYFADICCQECRQPLNVYTELAIINETLGITGSPDILWMNNDRMVVVEVKSIKGESFKTLEAPLPDHVFQAVSYHKLLTGRFPLHDEVIIMYASKQYMGWTSPYKEFRVSAFDPVIRNVVENSFETVSKYRATLAAGEMPVRLAACASPLSPIAKVCPTCTSCFL